MPEGPLARRVDVFRVLGDRAQPEWVAVEIADEVVDTSRQNVGVLVQRLLAKLKETPES